MNVRSADEQDLPQLYELCCSAAGRKLPRDVFEGIFRASAGDAGRRLFVAVEGDTVVGWADIQVRLLLSSCRLDAVLNEFYIKEDHRGFGAGTGLLIAMMNQAKKIGCRAVLADSTRVNLKSQEFLERHGFVRTQHRFEKEIK